MASLHINDMLLLISGNSYFSLLSIFFLVALVVLLLVARSNKKSGEHKDLLLQTALEIEMKLISSKDFDQSLIESFQILGQIYKLRAIALLKNEFFDSTLESFLCWDSEKQPDSKLYITNSSLKSYIQQKMDTGEPLQVYKSDNSILYNEEPVKELTLLPVCLEGKVWGVIAFVETQKAQKIKEGEYNILKILSRSIAALLEKKNTQKKLSLAKDNAESADQAKSEFLAIMSHEIRTPMNAIVGFADVLGETDLDVDQNEYVKIITRSCHDLLNLLNNILDYSHIESRHQDLKYEAFDLEILIVEVLDLILAKAKEKHLFLDYSFKDNEKGPNFSGDHMRLRQVLLNIVSNALKFTHEGFIKINVELEQKNKDLWGVKIQIKDSGIGIPDEALEKIFNPFTQADTSSTRKYGGVGLGLAICSRIIENMKGKLSVSSKVGEGSVFTIELCLEATADESNAQLNGFADKHFSTNNPLSLLLVQSESHDFEVLLEHLQKVGYRPDIATSMKEFSEKIPQVSYDCLLIDVKTSFFDGIEITEGLRAGKYGEKNKESYIVGMTNLVVPGEKSLCENAGMNNYLSKPIDIPKLKESLSKAYNWHKA